MVALGGRSTPRCSPEVTVPVVWALLLPTSFTRVSQAVKAIPLDSWDSERFVLSAWTCCTGHTGTWWCSPRTVFRSVLPAGMAVFSVSAWLSQGDLAAVCGRGMRLLTPSVPCQGQGHVVYQQWSEALCFKASFKNYTPAYSVTPENYCWLIKSLFLLLKVASQCCVWAVTWLDPYQVHYEKAVLRFVTRSFEILSWLFRFC